MLVKFYFRTVSKQVFKSSKFLSVSHTSRLELKKNLSYDLKGIFPPIPTIFSADQSVSYVDIQSNLSIWNHAPFSGYVVQGSNGEYPYLTINERIEVVEKVKSVLPSNKLLIAGSGCESTLATIEMTNAMADGGADVALVITPSFYKNQMNSTALLHHYLTVAEKSKVPVVLYNVPANTGINIPIETVAQLSRHENIIGIKDSGGDISRIGQIVNLTKENNFQVLAGSAGFLFASYCVGAVGGVCALANILGNEVCKLHQIFAEGSMEDAKKLQHRLIAPNAAVTAKYGVPGLKFAMELFGFKGGRARSPLTELAESDKENIKSIFKENGFL